MNYKLGYFSNRKRRIYLVFCLYISVFLASFPGLTLASESLKTVLEGIALNEQLLTNGRIELSCTTKQKVFSLLGMPEPAKRYITFHQHFVWVFKGNRWRIEETVKFGDEIKRHCIQVFDGEKRVRFIEPRDGPKLAVISGEHKYKTVRHGSPQRYVTELRESTSVADVLRKSESVRLVGREKIDGADCYLIRFKYGKEIKGAVWIDPARGYRFRKAACFMSGGHFVKHITDFKKYREGIWLPAKGSYTSYVKHRGEMKFSHKTVFSLDSVDLETEIDESVFVLKFPPGTLVSDKMANTVKKIPEERVVSEEELFKIAQKAEKGEYDRATLSEPHEKSSSFPKRYLIILIIVLIPSIIVICLVLGLRRKKEPA